MKANELARRQKVPSSERAVLPTVPDVPSTPIQALLSPSFSRSGGTRVKPSWEDEASRTLRLALLTKKAERDIETLSPRERLAVMCLKVRVDARRCPLLFTVARSHPLLLAVARRCSPLLALVCRLVCCSETSAGLPQADVVV